MMLELYALVIDKLDVTEMSSTSTKLMARLTLARETQMHDGRLLIQWSQEFLPVKPHWWCMSHCSFN